MKEYTLASSFPIQSIFRKFLETPVRRGIPVIPRMRKESGGRRVQDRRFPISTSRAPYAGVYLKEIMSMQSIKTKIISYIRQHRKIPLQQNVATYGVCLVIATALWFLNALNKTYVTEISYPVKYTDFPKGKLLVSELPEEMTLEIKAHGFALLRYKISTAFQPIVFNVNSYSNGVIEKNDLLSFTVTTAEVKERINSQLNQDIELLNIKPESVTFEFSRFQTKTVPVIPQVTYTLKHQYILRKDITVTPDSLQIEGPASIVDTLRAIYTKPVKYTKLSKSVDKKIKLQDINGLQVDIKDVRLQIEVERYTEARKTVPLGVKNLPDSLQIRLFPSSIDITFDVGLSNYDIVTDTSFVFEVDYDEIKNNPEKLPIHVAKRPHHIKDLLFTPVEVEYLIEKK